MILDMLEEHELTSVLNQLPPNAFDELFTGKILQCSRYFICSSYRHISYIFVICLFKIAFFID